MSTCQLHCIYDPLCGWCYGASPLIHAARDILPVHAHGGGTMTGAQRRVVTPDLRQFVMAHEGRRIAETDVILELAAEVGLDPDAFSSNPLAWPAWLTQQVAGDATGSRASRAVP